MQTPLEQFWEGEGEYQLAELELVIDLIRDGLSVFSYSKSLSDKSDGWVYEVPVTRNSETFSWSTNAMIGWALQTIQGVCRSTVLAPVESHEYIGKEIRSQNNENDNGGKEARSDLTTNIERSVYALISKVETAADSMDPCLTESETFGHNDPMTLGWLLELTASEENKIRREVETTSRQWLEYAVRSLKGNLDPANLPKCGDENGEASLTKALTDRGYRNAFWVLRWGHIAEILKDREDGAADVIAEFEEKAEPYFRQTLYEHLARRDSTAFDPGELVFSLEGLLRWGAQTPTKELLDDVFRTLRQAQETTAYWRPTRPIIRNERGRVLFPLSVEVAQSLMRSFHLLEEKDPRSKWFRQNKSLLFTYMEWIRSQSVKVNVGEESEKPITGWHSEYDPSRRSIHTWQTSQVVVFLAQYAYHTKRDFEKRLCEKGGFNNGMRVKSDSVDWSTWKAKNDPITHEHECGYRIQHRIGKHIVDCHGERGSFKTGSAKYSFILYGPPGTGKSVTAEQLARALGRRFIEITMSDFLQGGEAEVEARAKALFRALAQQHEAVILFDEIDRLILDRQSDGYTDQSPLFQFMTPGMLTKIQSLREQKGPIFVLGTNRWERIDPAIRRPGRIDEQYLLVPPDLERRRAYITKFVDDDELEVDEDTVKSVAARTPLWVYTELKWLVEKAEERTKSIEGEDGFGSALEIQLDEMTPSLKLSHYGKSFSCLYRDKSKFRWNREPWEEFLMLLYLMSEEAEEERVNKVRRLLKEMGEDECGMLGSDLLVTDGAWKEYVHCPTVKSELSEFLEKIHSAG